MDSFPFFRASVRLRTRYIDDTVRAALDAGLRQIVLLGAGFDCRGLRMAEIPSAGATVFEVDFDSQLATKRAILQRAGIGIPSHVRHVPCNLSEESFADSLAADLAAAGFQSGRGALFLWEGVVSYLDDASLDRTLHFVAAAGAPRAWLTLNYQLHRLHPDDLHRRLSAAGMTVLEDVDGDHLWARYQSGAPPPHGEFFRLALAATT